MLVRVMRIVPRVLTLLPTWFAVCTVVLPSGSALCIGSGGHVAVEAASPRGIPCCDAPVASAEAPSCASESDAPCEDISLDAGAALVTRPDLDTGPATVAAMDGPPAGFGPSSGTSSLRPAALATSPLRGTPVAHLIVQRR